MLLLIFLILVVLLVTNPVYSGNIGLMVSSTGIIAEYFTWATFAGTVGMGVAIPLIMRMKMRFRAKELMLASLVSMAVLSVVVATTDSAAVVVGSCLVFGFVKMFGMVEVVLPIRGILSPDGDNGRFYSIFYPIAIGAGQIGGPYLARLALSTGWQMLHFYSAALFLVTALLCVIVMHNQRFAPKMSLAGVDWLSVVLFAASLMCFSYVVTFGRQQDWFVSAYIRYASLGAVLAALWLVIRQLGSRQPLLKFGLYRISDVRLGLVLLIGQGMFMGAGAIQSIYTSAILGYNWMINASLSLMMLPGIVTAGFAAFHWTKNKIPLKMYIFSAFAAYVAYYALLYFMMAPGLSIEQFVLPQFLNGYAMGGLFISLWIFTLAKVPQQDMIFSVAPVMVFRSIVTTAFFSGFFGWLQYKFQWDSVHNLAFYFDTIMMNHDAAVGSFGSVQLSAILAANKKLVGYVIIAGFGFLALIFFHQFGHFKYRIAHYNVRKSRKERPREPVQAEDPLSGSIGSIAGSA